MGRNRAGQGGKDCFRQGHLPLCWRTGVSPYRSPHWCWLGDSRPIGLKFHPGRGWNSSQISRRGSAGLGKATPCRSCCLLHGAHISFPHGGCCSVFPVAFVLFRLFGNIRNWLVASLQSYLKCNAELKMCIYKVYGAPVSRMRLILPCGCLSYVGNCGLSPRYRHFSA